jgi:hypothetical protein
MFVDAEHFHAVSSRAADGTSLDFADAVVLSLNASKARDQVVSDDRRDVGSKLRLRGVRLEAIAMDPECGHRFLCNVVAMPMA